MRARHRLSKLLLRQGIAYSGGKPRPVRLPSEHSSGASRVQGSITKTANTHAHRLLVEAAWHHRARYAPGKTMRDRWELAPAEARARGDGGNHRLHQRWISFNLRKKRAVITNVAVARELAGWCWSLAVLDKAG